ncbi:MAG: PLP-dependent aspartate aminotransferase family protein [Rhodobacteraceae bacterium]|nr:PLP-dependent aspartate aminotransferase family protein [Paracoccaceae bacterium]
MKLKNDKNLSISTKIAQALHFSDPETGSVVPSIDHSATYSRDENYEPRQAYWYRRDGNKTTQLAEEIISELENANASLLFSSGMSACTAVLEMLPAEAHIAVPRVMYHGVLGQIQNFASKNRIRVDYYEAGDLASMESIIKNGVTQLVWVETPNNPNWDVTDISSASELAHKAGAKLIVDATATPPTMTKSLDLGADISFHSATKYLNGHSDISAGALSFNQQSSMYENLFTIRKLHGTVLNSQDAFLLIRGLRTLFLRVEKNSQNAMLLAKHFNKHEFIEKVLYPGLETHPNHQIAKHQTNGQFGGMLSVIVKGSQTDAINVVRNCKVFYPATSLGGVESLIEHRKTVSGDDFPVHENLIRISAGIEDPVDLINDLEQALNTVFKRKGQH